MKIKQQFTLNRPIDQVWAFFHDVPAVAGCLPGAEYLGQGEDGEHKGKMSMKVGPFQAAFEGNADVAYVEEDHKVTMTGKGVDKRGASRGKMSMICAIRDEDGATGVIVDADVQLSGSIAQFGRTGIIEEIVSTLIKDFVANVEEALPPAHDKVESGVRDSTSVAPKPSAPKKSGSIGVGRLLWMSLKSWVARRIR